MNGGILWAEKAAQNGREVGSTLGTNVAKVGWSERSQSDCTDSAERSRCCRVRPGQSLEKGDVRPSRDFSNDQSSLCGKEEEEMAEENQNYIV